MKNCAVICEYNPFHNGHKYQLQRIRELTDCDGIICVMSGDFVQRAEPATMDKFTRARCALKNGADMVTELPVPYAVGSGKIFARGAVEIVTDLPDVEFLAMGCETDSPELLPTLADIQLHETSDFKTVLKDCLKQGLSYPSAYTEATVSMADKHKIDSSISRIILSKPNNILCVEYIKSLKLRNSQITPLFIPRTDLYLDRINQLIKTASSTQIRKEISSTGKLSNIDSFVPEQTLADLISTLSLYPLDKQSYSDIALYVMKNMTADDYRAVPEIGNEGIEHRIEKAVISATNLDEVLSSVKSKRYTASRLKRIFLQCALQITNRAMSDITQLYSHVLGIKSKFKSYLSALPQNFYITSDENREMTLSERTIIDAEKRASRLYSLLTHNSDYRFAHKLVTV